MEILKKYLFDVVAVIAFAVVAYAYFTPATIDGRILYQHDSAAGRGAGEEVLKYKEKTGETSRWTLLSQHERAFGYHQGLPPMDARLRLVCFRLPFGLLHTVARIRFQAVVGCSWCGDMGLFKLFFHHHRCRTHLESDGPSLSAAHDCRYSVGL